MTYQDFLAYAMSDGVNAVVGVVLSFMVEWFPAYGQLSAQQKRLIFAALCLAVPVVAAILAVAAGFVPLDWNTVFWPSLRAGFLAFVGGNMAHMRKLSTARKA